MPNELQLTVDKFTFRVARDRLYTPEGIWACPDDGGIRVGLSDFLQQRSGDVAFAEVRPVGTELAQGVELAVIETIKVNISLATPIAGRVIAVNAAVADAPEAINQDPYGAGWLALLEADDWVGGSVGLLSPEAYLAQIKGQAEAEAGAA